MASPFDIDDLLAFRAVAELGSFRKAAESVHLSQPAFSRRIDKLEQALGVKLLERTTRRVSLTVVGRDFERQLRQILDALDTTLLAIRGVAATRMGEVNVAAVPSTVNYFLSSVIAQFHLRYPKVRVKIVDESANTVLHAVARGEVDFGLNFVGSQEADVDFEPLMEEQFVAACRRDHPLARKRTVRWSELAQYDYIAADKASGNRLLLDQALAGLPDQPRSLYETRHGTTMIGLVEAGLGVAVVPSMAMPAKDHPILASVPIVDPVVKRMVGLIRRKSTVLSPAAQALYDLCAQMRQAKRGRRPRA
ncbi:LysR family transcriptional regulator [Achromobacter sp. GG226]|uniref:LysR family transcriptional regulator n=1 Tax=Verticiella alkaliphila TaxID=2779529 RepID=UPI001C0C9673|nr:LysR family transcriptional regulator [Verticiella sp. GG226]MBU4609056.1 LysR family transcriptional regulator [Verticiella sp. GG226]